MRTHFVLLRPHLLPVSHIATVELGRDGWAQLRQLCSAEVVGRSPSASGVITPDEEIETAIVARQVCDTCSRTYMITLRNEAESENAFDLFGGSDDVEF